MAIKYFELFPTEERRPQAQEAKIEEKRPPETKKRKVVQIHTSFDKEGNMYVTHLTDDSRVLIWQGDGWHKIPPIPQD